MHKIFSPIRLSHFDFRFPKSDPWCIWYSLNQLIPVDIRDFQNRIDDENDLFSNSRSHSILGFQHPIHDAHSYFPDAILSLTSVDFRCPKTDPWCTLYFFKQSIPFEFRALQNRIHDPLVFFQTTEPFDFRFPKSDPWCTLFSNSLSHLIFGVPRASHLGGFFSQKAMKNRSKFCSNV